MLPLFARAGAAMIPGSGRLPFVGAGDRSDEVPELTLVLQDVGVDRDRLVAYDRVCKFPLRDQLPATYPHMLAFPLQLSLMTDPSFPFAPLGLVHVSNRVEQHRPLDAAERLRLNVWASPLESHPSGTQVTLCSEARVDEELLVWEERSAYLKRAGSTGGGSAGRERRGDEELPVTATWRLPGDLGRRYAAVSGDLNPIHIHPLSARLFGFPTAIAHGMWTKARCLAGRSTRGCQIASWSRSSSASRSCCRRPCSSRSARTRVGSNSQSVAPARGIRTSTGRSASAERGGALSRRRTRRARRTSGAPRQGRWPRSRARLR